MRSSQRQILKFTINNCNVTRYVSTINNVAENSTESSTQLKSWKEIPGPSTLPFIGMSHNLLPGGLLYKLNGYQLIEKLYTTFGPIVKLKGQFGAPTMIILFDAESSEKILRSENWFPKRPGFQSLEYFRNNYKRKENSSDHFTGLITDHGEIWRNLRSTVNPVMLQPKTIKLYSTILDEVAKDMIVRMRSLRDENNMIKGKFNDEMNLWALESIGIVALGGRLNCFDPNLPADSPARKLIQIVHNFFTIADKLDFKPSLWRIYPTQTFKRAMKLYEEQDSLNRWFIKRAMEKLKTEVKPDHEKGVLEKLLEIDENVAIIMASDLLFAGVDTASNTVIPVFYFLALNPEKQKKLREEVTSDNSRRPYLKACIKEAMRIMPVVAGNMRETSKEYNLLGYHIPKNTYVSFSHQYMSVMECHYPKPLEYIPERWIADKEDPLYHGNAHPFAYSPFGFGVRSCIGRRIAELEIETFVARVVENFHIEWFGEPLKQHQSSLNYVTGPFNFIFKDV